MLSQRDGRLQAETCVKVLSPEIVNVAQGQGFHFLEASTAARVKSECVTGNMRSLKRFYTLTMRMTLKWLNRRSQCKSFSWKSFLEYLEHYPLPRPKTVHNLYTLLPVVSLLLTGNSDFPIFHRAYPIYVKKRTGTSRSQGRSLLEITLFNMVFCARP